MCALSDPKEQSLLNTIKKFGCGRSWSLPPNCNSRRHVGGFMVWFWANQNLQHLCDCKTNNNKMPLFIQNQHACFGDAPSASARSLLLSHKLFLFTILSPPFPKISHFDSSLFNATLLQCPKFVSLSPRGTTREPKVGCSFKERSLYPKLNTTKWDFHCRCSFFSFLFFF